MPSAGFVMQPHEDSLPPLGFLDFEPRGQFEARQAIVLGFAGDFTLGFHQTPPRGRSVAYRRATYFTNSIYYRIDSEGVEIIRVLGRQDPEKQL